MINKYHWTEKNKF